MMFLVSGPYRHAGLVHRMLLSFGQPESSIVYVLTRRDGGNNERSQLDGPPASATVVETQDPRAIFEANFTELAKTLTPRTPAFALYNMFNQNSIGAEYIRESSGRGNSTVVRLRSDGVIYPRCVQKLRAGIRGLAENPIAAESEQYSDQFLALDLAAYANIWSTNSVMEHLRGANYVPETVIRDRAKSMAIRHLQATAARPFMRFRDFDIVYENARASDSPPVYWQKIVFGWRACYALAPIRNSVDDLFCRMHVASLRKPNLLSKTLNLLAKATYLPVFLAMLPRNAVRLLRFERDGHTRGTESIHVA